MRIVVLLLLALVARAEEPQDRYVVAGGEKLGAIDLSTGTWAWKRNGWGEAWAGTIGKDAVAYLAPSEGGLECVDLATGTRRWAVEGTPTGSVMGLSTWIAREGRTISSISLSTGKAAWSVTLEEDLDDIRPPSIAADEDAVFVHVRGGLIALSAKEGAPRWRREGEGFERLRVAGGGLYACAKYGGTPAYVRRIDRATGKDFWRCEIPTELEPAPVLDWNAPGLALVSSQRWGDEGWTYALDAATGEVRWSVARTTTAAWADRGGARAWMVAPPELRVVDTATGEGRAIDEVQRDGAAFLLDGNRMLVADWDPISCGVGLRAYDDSTCALAWKADVVGIEVPHSEYYHRVRLARLRERVLLLGESAGGTYIDLIDPETGRVTLANALR